MDKEKQAKVMADWYWNNPQRNALTWEILKDIRRHETAFISDDVNARYYKIGKFHFLKGQLHARFVKSHYHRYSFFRSMECLAFTKYNGGYYIPIDLKKSWNPYGADCCLDIDCKGRDIEKVARKTRRESGKILKYLDKVNCPAICSFSGRQGFHIKIEWDALAPRFSCDMEELKRLARLICKKARVNTKPSKTKPWIDTAIIHTKGLVRVLNSLHPKSLRVALPLRRDEFEDFDINTTDPYYIMKHISLANRRPVWNPKGNVDMLHKEFMEGGA